ncbi:MAG: hypothetical protein ABIO70_02690 [Pseudomonadota bacterium]
MKKLALLALALSLPACFTKTDSGLYDSNDTDGGTVPLSIDYVTYSYNANSWSYEVHCNGWADLVTLYITQDTSSPWDENHDLESWDFDDGGAWDVWGRDLPIVQTWQEQVDSTNTLFGNSTSCENPYCEGTMVWRVYAWEGSTVKDCVIWAGANADISLVTESGCREVTMN